MWRSRIHVCSLRFEVLLNASDEGDDLVRVRFHIGPFAGLEHEVSRFAFEKRQNKRTWAELDGVTSSTNHVDFLVSSVDQHAVCFYRFKA